VETLADWELLVITGGYRQGLTVLCDRVVRVQAEQGTEPPTTEGEEITMGPQEPTPDELARELAREINLMESDQRREFFRAFVARLDRPSYQQLENAMDVVI
jgi:hypothetical protein